MCDLPGVLLWQCQAVGTGSVRTGRMLESGGMDVSRMLCVGRS